jgi:hypothetical protein
LLGGEQPVEGLGASAADLLEALGVVDPHCQIDVLALVKHFDAIAPELGEAWYLATEGTSDRAEQRNPRDLGEFRQRVRHDVARVTKIDLLLQQKPVLFGDLAI